MNFDNSPAPDDDLDPVEGYCLHCRETIEMENPVAVWTRRGMPATRGECPICGGMVFRMGKSAVHDRLDEPDERPRVKLARQTVYVDFAPSDSVLAQQLAADLEKVGVACWLHESEPTDVNWAGGVHPALSACDRMIFVLTEAALRDTRIEEAWRYFRQKNKPIVVALLDQSTPPEDLRRRPRFDFRANYKTAFRQLLQALNDGK